MTLLAAIRPDDWNIALFVHVLGAMVLVGALVLAVTSLASRNLRLGFRALLFAAVPSWIAMRVGAQWIASKEGLDDPDVDVPGWVDIGFITSESSFLLIVAATVCTRIAMRRAGGGGLRNASLGLLGIVLVAYAVAIWAMTFKPS